MSLHEKVSAALANVRNPRLGVNVLDAEMVRDVALTTDGKVRLTLLMAPDDNAMIVKEVRQAVEKVSGVTDVRVDIRPADAPAARPAAAPSAPAPRSARALPVMGQEPASQNKGVPAPTPVTYPNLGTVIAISSGKGGVGKSTVATNLAIALSAAGKRVGLMDADIYGPNIPRMMGVNAPPEVHGQKIIPLEAFGVKVMSVGFLIERDQPAIWRGPIIMKIITQFLRDVEWGQLDYFLVDMPPGTGDAQLSLVQATQVSGAVIVTTPQEVAAGDSLRGAKMFERVTVPVIGVVENMSWLECDGCGKRTALFGTGGGQRLADEIGVPLLGQIPIYAQVMEGGDVGRPIVVGEPDSAAAGALIGVAERIMQMARRAQ